jgi:hypothetical protein
VKAADGAGGEDDVRTAAPLAETIEVEAQELGRCRGELCVDAFGCEPRSVWGSSLRDEVPRRGYGSDSKGTSYLEKLSAL